MRVIGSDVLGFLLNESTLEESEIAVCGQAVPYPQWPNRFQRVQLAVMTLRGINGGHKNLIS